MLRRITKTVGSAMATLCLVSTLAIAQDRSPSQTQNPAQLLTPQYGNTTMDNPSRSETMRLLCTKDDGKGNCTAATGADGKAFVVQGDGLKSGAYMHCVNKPNVVDCEPAS